MIHFCFTVSDTDAENIINIMDNAVIVAHNRCTKAIANKDAASEQWYNKHIEYLNELKQKMANVRVQEIENVSEYDGNIVVSNN
jgi:hypothetical protein